MYTYWKLILKSPSGRINNKVLYCIVLYDVVVYITLIRILHTDQQSEKRVFSTL